MKISISLKGAALSRKDVEGVEVYSGGRIHRLIEQ